jgi:hypothetical protein
MVDGISFDRNGDLLFWESGVEQAGSRQIAG